MKTHTVRVVILACLAGLLTAAPASAQVLLTTYIEGSIRSYNPTTGAALPNVTNGISGPAGITRGPDGFLYVSSQSFVGGNDLILKVNPTTGAQSTFINLGVGYQPSALRFGPDGNLYVNKFVGSGAPAGSGSVDKFNGSTGAALGTVVSGLTSPTGLAIDNLGRMYISNQGAGNVVYYNGTTSSVLIPNGTGGLAGPSGLTIGPNGNLFVVDLFSSSVKQYSTSGSYIGDFASGASLNGNFPSDLLFDTNNRLWVSNLGATFASPTGSLVRFNGTTGAFVDTVASNLYGASQLVLNPVPEPSTLLAVGGTALFAFGARRARALRRQASEPSVSN